MATRCRSLLGINGILDCSIHPLAHASFNTTQHKARSRTPDVYNLGPFVHHLCPSPPPPGSTTGTGGGPERQAWRARRSGALPQPAGAPPEPPTQEHHTCSTGGPRAGGRWSWRARWVESAPARSPGFRSPSPRTLVREGARWWGWLWPGGAQAAAGWDVGGAQLLLLPGVPAACPTLVAHTHPSRREAGTDMAGLCLSWAPSEGTSGHPR